MPVDFVAFAYAAAVAGGGILGYVKSNSIPSLGAGLLFGGFLGYGAFRVSQDPHDCAVLLGTSAILGSMMGYRSYSSGYKIMPSGMIAIMSAAMVCRVVYRYFTIPQQLEIHNK